MKEERRVRCRFCGGTIPAGDFEVQIEHMLNRHAAKDVEEAKTMALMHFEEIE